MTLESKRNIDILINRYLEKKCTQVEKQQLYELLTSSDNERSFKEVLFSHLNEFLEDHHEKHSVDFDRIYNQLHSEIKQKETRESEKRLLQSKNKVIRLIITGLSIAAVFCIAFYLGRRFNQKYGEVSQNSYVQTTYNEIKAPLGSKSEVKLTDGTEVILNAGSTIKYRSDFNSFNRDLILEGEAYFRVAKNPNLPLIVNAGKLNIKATGTEFNIKAYSEEGIVETTLIEGKVEISQLGDYGKDKTLVLKPNQKAIYASESDRITLEKIKEIEPLAIKPTKLISDKLLISPKTDIDQTTAWIKNKLIIRRENLESLCVKLQRKYDVTFVFGDEEIKKLRFTGVLLDETFEQVMDVIKLTAPIKYSIDGKVVTLFSNSEKLDKFSKRLKNS